MKPRVYVLLQVLGESFSPMKSKQLSYCKFWGAFKINGSEAIASFGGEFSPPSNSWFKKLLQVLGGTSARFGEPVKSRHSDLLQVFEETLQANKINGSGAIASFWGDFVS